MKNIAGILYMGIRAESKEKRLIGNIQRSVRGRNKKLERYFKEKEGRYDKENK